MFRSCILILSFFIGLAAVDSRGPQLTHLSSTKASVLVHMDEATQLILFYEDTPDNILRINNAKHKHQLFNLKNLKPNTTYNYTISGNGIKMGPYQFTTPPLYEKEITFCVYGHSRRQNNNDETHKRLVAQMLKIQPDMLVHTGNVFGGGPRSNPSYFGRDWTYNFFKPLQEILPSTPFYLSPGQHDVSFVKGLDTLTAAFPHMAGRLVYTVERGPMAMCFLCIPQRLSDSVKQLAIIESAFQKMSFARWRFVCMHVPPHGVGLREWVVQDRKRLWELFQKYRIDFVLCGRQQNYQRLYPLRVSTDDQHAVTVISTSLGLDSLRGHNDILLKGNDRDLHFVKFNCSEQQVRIQAINLDGRVIDHAHIDKSLYASYLKNAKLLDLSD